MKAVKPEETAELTMSEESRDGLRCRKYRESPDRTHRQPKTILSFPPYPQRQTRLLESFAPHRWMTRQRGG